MDEGREMKEETKHMHMANMARKKEWSGKQTISMLQHGAFLSPGVEGFSYRSRVG